MPQCPYCKGTFKNRKKGACPSCHTPVILHEGAWYDERPVAPSVQLLDTFLKLYRKRNKVQLEMTFQQRITSLAAANTYLNRCGGDVELAKAVMEFQFTAKGFSWKDRGGITYLFHDLGAALPRVRAERYERDHKKALADQFLDSLMGTSNVPATT